MISRQDLFRIQVQLRRTELSLHQGFSQMATLLRECDEVAHQHRLSWLEAELCGYQQHSFPPSYVPPARNKLAGELYRIDNIPPSVKNYRSQVVVASQQRWFGTLREQRTMPNLMPLVEIDHNINRLGNHSVAIIGSDRGWELRTTSMSFIQLRFQLLTRLDDLVDDVLANCTRTGLFA